VGTREERDAIRDGHTENFNYNGNALFLFWVVRTEVHCIILYNVCICLKYIIIYKAPPKDNVNLTFLHHLPTHNKKMTLYFSENYFFHITIHHMLYSSQNIQYC
jgi:hypothetical protein